jgi:hypothetical protein
MDPTKICQFLFKKPQILYSFLEKQIFSIPVPSSREVWSTQLCWTIYEKISQIRISINFYVPNFPSSLFFQNNFINFKTSDIELSTINYKKIFKFIFFQDLNRLIAHNF